MSKDDVNAHRLELDPILTIRTITEIHEQVMSALNEVQHLEISVPEVGEVDLSFLQLIEAARITAEMEGKQISLVRPASQQLRDLLERGGFLTDMDPNSRTFWLHERQNQ
ncbi:STAS domain-containing protein [Allorhizobium sp. BGMRC 0089]|uniref:STAS domain-containing protein n=1 Tax=Allorhizobium sonneratiae TaxID=2934936 RepID=UPI002033BAC3|nr:STAS domain-containing protein [Allorhizobium sonneratiae]MCM2293307.1 STAS domain-containing protein [Allorhizobium sonneratiae]